MQNSITNPHAVCEKPEVEHSLGVDILAILTVCVPNSPISISFVSPDMIVSVFPTFTAWIIVSHESSANDFVSGF